MIDLNAIILYLRNLFEILTCFFKTRLMSNIAKDMEILALRSQLSIVQQNILNRKMPKPRFTPLYRQLLVMLSKVFPDWKSTLFLVKPETVIGWHKNAFKLYWKRKSRKTGRPKISSDVIVIIR